MKRRLIVLISCVLLVMAALCVSASAADDPLKVAVQLSTSTFTEPQQVTVSIQVSNTSDADMPGPVTLYDPDGNQIEEFGSPVLSVGASKTWEGTWFVTQDQLNAGKIPFKLRYTVYNDAGELVSKTRSFSKPIKYEGAVINVEINRTISPTFAGAGQEVTVTYEVINTGTVEVSDVVITEDKSISSSKGKISSVPSGEKGTYSFRVKMGKKDLTSQATITYRANGSSQTVTKEAATIRYGEMDLSASLAADKKGGAPGETVKLTLTLKNTGKTDYTGIVVTDPVLGEVFSGLTVAAGKTETFTREVTMADTVSYQFAVTAADASGNQVETATGTVTLTAVSASEVVSLDVKAEADRSTVYELPGTVKFKVSVTNNSTKDVSDVVVKASGVTLYTFPTILAGETRDFTRDVSVSMQGQYQFVASTANQLGEKVSFNSNIIQIAYSLPTAVPTEAPIVTPPRPQLLDMPTEADVDASTQSMEQVLKIALYVFGALAGIGLLLLLISVAGHAAKAVHAGKVVDQLELSGSRDYETPHDGEYEYGETHVEETPEAAAEVPAEEAQDEAEKSE